MSINLTDEIEVKTKKGKLGAAKQIFLEGDTQTVENEIQDINSRHNDLNSKHESLSSTVSEHTNQIESNQNQITANKSTQDAKNASLDANMAKLNTRDDQITELVRGITATGGASVATTVTYDNTSSHLASATVQGAIDELQGSKIDKTSILQELGNAEDKVMSQKAVSDAINKLKNAGYLYAGIATPTTNPGTPDGSIFYIASQAGTYSNFGGIEIDSAGIFTWNGTSWSFEKLGFIVDIPIVNDLTTGGEVNALSAEMGKVLNETVILDSIDISFSISKYLNTSGVETSWYDGKCTDFYACNLGDVFAFTGAGSQSRVCAYDANKDFIKLLQSSGGTNITITINDSTIKYVRASGNVSDNTKSFAKINYKSIGHLRNDIDALNNEFNTELNDNIDDDLTEGGTLGNISSLDGQIHESTSHKYKEYNVKKDSVLTLKCYVQSNTAVLCKKLADGKYQSLVTPTGFSVQTYTYTATEDMTICICYEISNTINAGGYFTSRNKKLVEINNSISTLNSSVIEQITDDLSDAITGKYIGMDGAIYNGTGFSYKEFSVKASAMLNLYCGSHNNIAVFAKKIDDTHYEPLVRGDFNTNIFNYVVLEDMVLAVSIYLNNSSKLEITTYYPQSNRKNIENVLAQQQEINNNLAIQGINIGFMFDNIAVIGDSMACGTLEGYEGFSFGSSWLSFLAKRWGCKSKYHYANSGTSAYKWLNNTMYGLGRMLTDTKVYNAYFIAYGHNDSESVGSATDEAAPVTINDNVPSCPSGYSFSAYYKAIIDQIRLKAPHAMIFCLSQYDRVMMYNKATYGQAVIDIADLYYNNGDKLVHHLETGGVPDADMGLVSHYSTIGYAYIARMVDKCVNDVVYQYRADTEIKEFGHYNLPTHEDSPWE